MERWSVLAALSIVLALAGACSGSTKSEPTTTLALPAQSVRASTAVPEDALAKQLLLTLVDLGTGWGTEPSQVWMSWANTCNPGPVNGRTGDAQTRGFLAPPAVNTGNLSEEVAVFGTVQDASASLDSQPSIEGCIVKLINEGRADPFSNASFLRLPFPKYGDRTEAFRLQLHLKVKGQSGPASEASVFLDIVSLSIGRTELSVTAYSVLTPFDTSTIELFVAQAASKAQQGLQ